MRAGAQDGRKRHWTVAGPCGKIETQQTNREGRCTADYSAWDGWSRERMVREICRLIDEMPEEEAREWAERHLYPMVERVRQREKNRSA